MKKNWKKILLIILSVLATIVLSIVIYFYIALSGNPIEKWQEKNAIIKLYEDLYNQDFKVERSSYDYKRGEFDFVLFPEDDPLMTFRTTLDQTRYKDTYGEARSKRYLSNIISKTLGSDFDYLDYHMNVHEEYKETDAFETNLVKRIGINSYVVDFSWDVEKIYDEEIDAVFKEIVTRIEDALDVELGDLEVSVSVYDGEDYYFNNTVIDK